MITIKTRTPWPGNAWCLQYAHDVLSRPPAKPHIERHHTTGRLVWECVVPAEYCATGNTDTFGHWSGYARRKKKAFAHMAGQKPPKLPEPLPGRPCVHAIRFTASKPDVRSNWDKAPVDCLVRDFVRRSRKTGRIVQRHRGFGLLRDDNPDDVDLHAWWEPGKRGRGFVLIRVFEGDEP